MVVVEFDFKKPDYVAVIRERLGRLARIRKDPGVVPALKVYYRDYPWQFISDWGMTYDPRNVERNLPAVIPFVLFPKQIEFVQWLVDHWRRGRPGLAEKTRDMGLSWLCVSAACTLCLHYEGMAIGFGSRKEEYVDRIGAPKSLFFKARMFMENLPVEFRGGWVRERDAPHMRINFPETNSNISGEAGDNIGRGDRTGIYVVDEAAYLERPELIEASLSQTTNCRIDVSSANGMANSFALKRHGGKIDVFTFHWRDDPRKDQAWYDKQVADLDPITVAQEIDIDYSASAEGVLIPSAWVQAAIDAHVRLGFKASGARTAALDVADEGADLNAFCGATGMVVDLLNEWSGKGGDIFGTVQWAFNLCDEHSYAGFTYDSDGLGAGVRGDARVINERRKGQRSITTTPWRGSGEVHRPEAEDVKGRKNGDFFANAKAQAYWALRTRFQKTYRAIKEGVVAPHDELISLSSKLPLLSKLSMELSQPTYAINGVGKVVVDKKPDGARSPNLADAVMMKFAPGHQKGLVITDELLARSAGRR